MATAVRLKTSGNVVLDGTGYGYIRLSPTGEKWQVTRTHVECSDRTNEAECRLYDGYVATTTIIDGTYAGSSGDTSDVTYYLEDGEAVFIVWTGGTAGATASVTLSGWKSLPEGGFRAVH